MIINSWKSKLLLASGVLICSFSQIASRYLTIGDLSKALLMGFGIGLLIIAVFQFKKTSKI